MRLLRTVRAGASGSLTCGLSCCTHRVCAIETASAARAAAGGTGLCLTNEKSDA